MPNKTITVRTVYPPDRNPSFGRIITTDGEKFSVKAAMMKQFAAGMSMTVAYDVVNGYNNVISVQDDAPSRAANAVAATNNGDKDRFICRQAIAKSIIEARLSDVMQIDQQMALAESWVNWCMDIRRPAPPPTQAQYANRRGPTPPQTDDGYYGDDPGYGP